MYIYEYIYIYESIYIKQPLKGVRNHEFERNQEGGACMKG